MASCSARIASSGMGPCAMRRCWRSRTSRASCHERRDPSRLREHPVRMNVLLVVFDTARADALEPYGAVAGASPAVADVARRGRAVDGVHSTACWTLPSHASMLSGALPRALGLTQAPGGTAYGSRPVIEGLRDRWLPEVLRRHGWRTQAVSCNVWISALGGWDTGFDDFTTIDSGREARLGRPGRRERLAWVLESARARSDDGGAEAGAGAGPRGPARGGG